jgi:hypothetical protein
MIFVIFMVLNLKLCDGLDHMYFSNVARRLPRAQPVQNPAVVALSDGPAGQRSQTASTCCT